MNSIPPSIHKKIIKQLELKGDAEDFDFTFSETTENLDGFILYKPSDCHLRVIVKKGDHDDDFEKFVEQIKGSVEDLLEEYWDW